MSLDQTVSIKLSEDSARENESGNKLDKHSQEISSTSHGSSAQVSNTSLREKQSGEGIDDAPEEPTFSYIQMLDVPRELGEPIDITIDYLKQISDELGLIKLCWPDLSDVTFEDRSNFPESYLKNSNKEKLLLLYAENFRRQFCYKYPDRKPLILACDNECGMQKMVCTTIRPTTLSYSEVCTWQNSSRFVADHLKYEPLEEPVLIKVLKNGVIQKNVAEITRKTFTLRTLKDHLQLILETSLQKDSDSHQKKSGVEETFSERDQLLQEVSDLFKNAEPISSSQRKRPMSKEQQIAELGKKSRDQWALKFSDSDGNQEHIEVIVVEDRSAKNSSNDLDDIVIENVAPPVTTSEPKDNVELLLPATPNISTNLRKDKSEDKGKKRVLGPVRHRNNRGA